MKIELIEIDRLHWLPGWRERPEDEFRRIIDEKTARDSWVIDGGYTRLHDLTLARSDAIVWLNHSFARVLYRAFTRTVKRAITGEEIFNGCRESLHDSFLTKDSILWWVLTTWKRKRNRYRAIFDHQEYGHKEYIELRNQRDVDRLIDEL